MILTLFLLTSSLVIGCTLLEEKTGLEMSTCDLSPAAQCAAQIKTNETIQTYFDPRGTVRFACDGVPIECDDPAFDVDPPAMPDLRARGMPKAEHTTTVIMEMRQ